MNGLGVFTRFAVGPAEFFEIPAQFHDTRVQGLNARVVIGVDLPQPLELRLCRNQLTGEVGGHIQHRFSFLLNVECIVLAGKLSQLVRSFV